MTARKKIEVHVRTFSMEFGDTSVKFIIFEALKHLAKVHSLFNIDAIDGLVEDYFRIGTVVDTSKLRVIGVATLINAESDFRIRFQKANRAESNSKEKKKVETNSNMQESVETKLINLEGVETNSYSQQEAGSDLSQKESQQIEAESNFRLLGSHSYRVGQPTPSIVKQVVSPQSNTKLKPLPKHLKQQQRRLNPTLLDVVKKEVTKLVAAIIIYPISDSQWVSLVQVVRKKTGMTVVRNQQDEMVPTRIQNSWRVCINYRKLNQVIRKDHFPLSFINQVLEKLARKSRYMQFHIAPMDQHKTTFTCPFGTFTYTRMPFGLYNALSTF
ncbi:hypothetical protein CR513_17149, partial [Mucuna pruriens]